MLLVLVSPNFRENEISRAKLSFLCNLKKKKSEIVFFCFLISVFNQLKDTFFNSNLKMALIWKKKVILTSSLLNWKKICILDGDITKKIKQVRIQGFLYWKGCLIGYLKRFKWLDTMVRFKGYVYFYQGRWKYPRPILHSFHITAFSKRLSCSEMKWEKTWFKIMPCV